MPKPKPKKNPTHRPLWLKRLSWRTFPRGPRALYCYLQAFSSGQCWLYNYRLAATFDVSIRTIQLWLRWLTTMSLVHIYWIHGSHRRIVPHHYRSSTQWLLSVALPKPKHHRPRRHTTHAGDLPWQNQTKAQFEARKQALIRSLSPRK